MTVLLLEPVSFSGIAKRSKQAKASKSVGSRKTVKGEEPRNPAQDAGRMTV